MTSILWISGIIMYIFTTLWCSNKWTRIYMVLLKSTDFSKRYTTLVTFTHSHTYLSGEIQRIHILFPIEQPLGAICIPVSEKYTLTCSCLLYTSKNLPLRFRTASVLMEKDFTYFQQILNFDSFQRKGQTSKFS